VRFLLTRCIVAAALLAAVPAWGADFDAGMTAARAGDFAAAFREWKPLADAGHARAQVNLGEMYETGTHVDFDLVEAARLYRAAAEGGLAIGQLRFAMALQKGEGVAKDKAAAMTWLVKAAEQHNAQAIYEIGYAYHEGEGVPADPLEAMKWFIVADEYGHDEAYYAGTFVADRLTNEQLIAASQAATDWMAKHPRPETR
jgi:TPR repeat protein